MDIKKEKRDIRVVFLVFAVFFAFFAWRHHPSLVSYILAGLVVLILGLITFSPYTLRPAFRLWLKVAHAIGKFNTQVLLVIVYMATFIPFGALMGVFRNDPMKRKKAGGTYWESCKLQGSSDKSRYERQF